jgi:pimeloyl-ACP methyl ester carboxylesterase
VRKVLRRRRFSRPETQSVESDGARLAYQVAGTGALDVLVSPPMVSSMNLAWEGQWAGIVYRHLAECNRLVMFDKRGMGASDRTVPPAPLEQAIEDMRAVMDAAGSERAVLVGLSEGTAPALLFAATYPERAAGLISFGGAARVLASPDYPWGRTPGPGAAAALRQLFEGPRDEAADLIAWIGNLSKRDRRRFVDMIRGSADLQTTQESVRLAREVDVRSILPGLDLPTLLVHGQADVQIPVESGRYLAEHIRGARLLELPDEKHLPTGQALARALEEADVFLETIAAGEATRSESRSAR